MRAFSRLPFQQALATTLNSPSHRVNMNKATTQCRESGMCNREVRPKKSAGSQPITCQQQVRRAPESSSAVGPSPTQSCLTDPQPRRPNPCKAPWFGSTCHLRQTQWQCKVEHLRRLLCMIANIDTKSVVVKRTSKKSHLILFFHSSGSIAERDNTWVSKQSLKVCCIGISNFYDTDLYQLLQCLVIFVDTRLACNERSI